MNQEQAHHYSLPGEDLPLLVQALSAAGYQVAANTLVNGYPALRPINDASELPRGASLTRGPGVCELRRDGGAAWFGITVGQDTWKRLLFPPEQELLNITRQEQGFAVQPRNDPPGAPLALLGVRPCDLAALARLDLVLLHGPYPDATYAARRKGLLVVGVECSAPDQTCFCAAAGLGPELTQGFDLALHEVAQEGEHYFVARAGSVAGQEIVDGLRLSPATEAQVGRAQEGVRRAREAMAGKPDVTGLADRLAAAHDHPGWQEVAGRCLACGNCTMVCPTCFCHDLADSEDLDGAHAVRRRRWSSCFLEEFSYIHGGCIRSSPASRYRQWCSHKLSHWVAQFGVLGCVGCGRCVSFCPAGIDLAREAWTIAQALDSGGKP